jgi:nicotinamide mononucleotide adenylyltransferase
VPVGVWKEEHVKRILEEFGVVVLIRDQRVNFWEQFVSEHTVLYRRREHIVLVQQHVRNDISSTKLRAEVAAGRSARYLTPQPVVDYIHAQGLWRRCTTGDDRTPLSVSCSARL